MGYNKEEKYVADSVKKLNKQVEDLSKSASQAIGGLFGLVKEQLTEEEFIQWEELTNRLLTARVKGDDEMVESLEKDLSELFDKPKE